VKLEKTILSLRNKTYRTIWKFTWFLLCSWTPVFLFSWRRCILILFGAKIEKGACVYPNVKIWDPRNVNLLKNSCLGPYVNFYNVAEIKVGEASIISQYSTLCSASRQLNDFDILLTANIEIGKSVWIAMEAFVGPGIQIGNDAVIYARSVVVKDVPEGSIVAGNPAKEVKKSGFSINEA
jgi:putative colanic acid biosynthesis acetyltransferase WcaF